MTDDAPDRDRPYMRTDDVAVAGRRAARERLWSEAALEDHAPASDTADVWEFTDRDGEPAWHYVTGTDDPDTEWLRCDADDLVTDPDAGGGDA